MLVFYRLNSAMERGTKPDALGRKPCHWTRILKAAMVNARVVYPNSTVNSIAPKTEYNAPSQHLLEGDNAMVSHHVFSQLVLLALLWLFVIVHLAWPKRPVTTPAVPALPEPLTPNRPRSNEPKPFEGLT